MSGLDLEDLVRLDRDAGKLCRGYGIEDEFAVLVRTTPNNSFRLISEQRPPKALAEFLRKAADLIDSGAVDIKTMAPDH